MKSAALNVAALTCALFALNAPAQDLLSLHQAALRHDATWLAARAAAEAGREKLPQARAQLLPSLTANANTTENDSSVRYDNSGTGLAVDSDRRYSSRGYGATLAQPVFRAQNFVGYSVARLQVEEAELRLRLAEQDLALRVAQAYFDVLLAQDNLAFVNAQKAAIEEQWQVAKRSFELGTVTITDANEAEARLDIVRAQEIAAQSDLEIKQNILAQITGLPSDDLATLADDFAPEMPAPADLQWWLDRTQTQNLGIEIQRRLHAIGQREVRRQRAGHLPTVDIVGSYNNTHADGGTLTTSPNDTESTSLSLQLQLPIFQGGAQQSRVREALANRARAEQDAEQAQRTAAVQTRQAFLGVVNGRAQVAALERALRSSESALKSNQVGLEVGVRTGVDVLNAQQQLFNAKRDLAQARYSFLINLMRLRAATAELSEPELQALNKYFVSRK